LIYTINIIYKNFRFIVMKKALMYTGIEEEEMK